MRHEMPFNGHGVMEWITNKNFQMEDESLCECELCNDTRNFPSSLASWKYIRVHFRHIILMNASGKENARCLDSDSDHISQCTHPQVTSYLVSSKPNSLAHCRQTTLNVVATGCVEAALQSFGCDLNSAPTLTPWRVGEAEEEVRGWS